MGGTRAPPRGSGHARTLTAAAPLHTTGINPSTRIMKKALPANAKVAKDAKETVQECVSEFISFITSECVCGASRAPACFFLACGRWGRVRAAPAPELLVAARARG